MYVLSHDSCKVNSSGSKVALSTQPIAGLPSLFSLFMVEVRSEIAPDPVVRKMPGGAYTVFSGTDLQMYTLTSTDAPLVDYDHFKSKKILSK